MEHLFPLFNKAKTIELTTVNKYEMINQIFASFEGDFRNISIKLANFIKYDLVFPFPINDETKNELNEIVYEIALGLFFECRTHGLFASNDQGIQYFPYYLENLNQSTCLLRVDQPFTNSSMV